VTVDETMNVERVLLVDDEPAVFALVRRLIHRAHPGAVVVYASDLATAEWQLRSTSVRLVLTDMCFGDDASAGIKLLELARELSIRAAVLTGGDSLEVDKARGLCVAVLYKQRATGAELSRLVAEAFAQ
jgi:response regulator of citrate/malate metabolism